MICLLGEQERQIREDGERVYPNEACGMLLGSDVGGERQIRRVLPIENVFEAGERHHRFSIDPLDFLKAEREAEKSGLSVLGIYHSHPDHPAAPSEYDLRLAWPYYSYIIVSVEGGQSCGMTCWRLDADAGTFREERILPEDG
ncbi:MAG: M67 family metallopeptidase [Clostridiales Family XIII bacterium]|jgi:proteasome lid subunit RPN8/RPN11|nr:M67 family metallopeptidase [Clostridiales Family XIII bacterium]